MIRKILYIGSAFENSEKSKGESLNKKAFYSNFLEMGYEVHPVWYDYQYDNLQDEILKEADRSQPDMIFFILQTDQIEHETLKSLKEKGYFMVNFFGDDQWRFDNYSKYYANYFNACITTDKFSIEKYLSLGQKNIIRGQWASLESHCEYKNIEYSYEVSFIGGACAYRSWFVKGLERRGIKVNCFGDRWENGRVSYDEMEKIFSSTKINLNISNSTQYDLRYLLASPRNLINTLRSPKNVSQTKARFFEIPTQGGFQLAEYVPSLEDYFAIGNEISCYKDIDEAALLIKYYLSHDKERESIKEAGVKRARLQHTYRHRIESFMSQIEKIYEN
ncbi:CgeB family protein [Halobacteriovorax marinus]|uniref:CgeB family protein n=1 Tax=Halobacteriovorax marinus TaxID=97084 RepID=UPI003A92E439